MSQRHDHPAAARGGAIRDALGPLAEVRHLQDDGRPNTVELPLWLVFSHRWRLLVAITIIAAAAGYLYSFTIPRTFQAAATLILTPANTLPASQVAALTNARTLFENRSLAASVIRELQVTDRGRLMHPEVFSRDRLKVSQIRDTNYLRLTLTLSSPSEAATTLQTFIERGIQLNRQLTVENTTSVARGLLKAQLDEARANLDRRTRELETYRDEARLEVVKSDVEQAAALRSTVAELDGSIEFERARIAQGERQLAARSRTLSQPRRGSGALFESARREAEPDKPHPVPPVQTEEPPKPKPAVTAPAPPAAPDLALDTDLFADPVYEVLDYQVATGKNRLAALQAQRAELVKRGAGPLNQLYAAEARLDRLKLEHQLATDVYKSLVIRYEQARESAMSQSASIQVADPATPPEGPAGPKRPLSAAIAAVFGLLVGLTFVLLSATRRGLEPRAVGSAESG